MLKHSFFSNLRDFDVYIVVGFKAVSAKWEWPVPTLIGGGGSSL